MTRTASFVAAAVETGRIEAVGEEITAAILFCDIRGVAQFSHRVMVHDAIHTLNRFYSILDPIVAVH